MRRTALILSVVGLLVLAGCSGSVSGQVASKSAQKPVPAATVKVGDQTVTTDTGGRFTIDKVGTGSQKVAVEAEGYGPYTQALDVQRGDNTLNVTLEDGTVMGVLRENAVVKEPIKQAKVTVAGEKVTLDGNRFTAVGVPVGEQTVTVIAPGHERLYRQIEIAPGVNEVKLALDIGVVATSRRYEEAKQAKRYRRAYAFLHPDIRSLCTFAKFVAGVRRADVSVGSRYKQGQPQTGQQALSPPAKPMVGRGALAIAKFLNDNPIILDSDSAPGGVVTRIDLESGRMLAKWRLAYLRETFQSVQIVDRVATVKTRLGEYWWVFQPQHWQQIGGRWYIIFDWHN
jgi:hypothetical protein